MLGDLIGNGSSLLIVVMGLVYLAVIQAVSKRAGRPRKLSDAEMLTKLARLGNCTEHDIFRAAALEWHVPVSRIDDDFKRYLLEDIIPYYVNGFVRQKGKALGGVFRPPFFPSGGGYMPWLR